MSLSRAAMPDRGGAAAGEPGLTTVPTTSPPKLAASVERLQAALREASGKAAYLAGLRRYRDSLMALPVACDRQRTAVRVARDLEQAHKDVTREAGVYLNGELHRMDGPTSFWRFVTRLMRLVAESCPAAAVGATAASPHAAATADGDGSDSDVLVATPCLVAIVCDLLISCSRTMTGGDTLTRCHELLRNDELVVLAAETATQSPVEIIIGRDSGTVLSVNTYRICHMMGGDEGGGDGSGAGNGLEVWARLRCRLTEVVTYAAITPTHPGDGDVDAAAATAAAGAGAGASTSPPRARPDRTSSMDDMVPVSFAAFTGDAGEDGSEGLARLAAASTSAGWEHFAATAPRIVERAASSLRVLLSRQLDVEVRMDE